MLCTLLPQRARPRTRMEGSLWIPDQVWLLATLHSAQGILFGIKQIEALKAISAVLIHPSCSMNVNFLFLFLFKKFSVKYT